LETPKVLEQNDTQKETPKDSNVQPSENVTIHNEPEENFEHLQPANITPEVQEVIPPQFQQKTPTTRMITGHLVVDGTNELWIMSEGHLPAKILQENSLVGAGDVITAVYSVEEGVGRVVDVISKYEAKIMTGNVLKDDGGHLWMKNDLEYIFINPHYDHGARPGDLVTVKIMPPRPDGRKSCHVISVNERVGGPRKSVGIVQMDDAGNFWMAPDVKNKKELTEKLEHSILTDVANVYVPKGIIEISQDDVITADIETNMDGKLFAKNVELIKQPQEYQEASQIFSEISVKIPEESEFLKVSLTIEENWEDAKGDSPPLPAFPSPPPLYNDPETSDHSAKASESSDKFRSIVIDSGGFNIKAGMTGDEHPVSIFSNVVGRPIYNDVMSTRERDFFVGEEALRKRGILKLDFPVERGSVQNWQDMEVVWRHTFENELRTDSKSHPVFLMEPPLNPKWNRERMLDVMFDKFQVPSAFVAVQATLSMYASGRNTGVVLDAGDGVCHTVPIYEGTIIDHAVGRLQLAGKDVTDYLNVLLTQKGGLPSGLSTIQIVREIKENSSYVLQTADSVDSGVSRYELPDGQVLELGAEMHRCTELLFNPSLVGREDGGVHHLVHGTVNSCDVDIRKDILGNVLLSGGTTCIRGFPERLQNELSKICHTDVRVTAPKGRNYSAWEGASMVANSPAFSSRWITKREWEEYGPSIAHKKAM